MRVVLDRDAPELLFAMFLATACGSAAEDIVNAVDDAVAGKRPLGDEEYAHFNANNWDVERRES